MYSVQIKSGHTPQDIVNQSPIRAPSHVPPHDTAATAYPNVWLVTAEYPIVIVISLHYSCLV